MSNSPVFECHLNTGQPNHLNARQMDAILFSYVLILYSSGQSSTQDSKQTRNLKSELQKVWFSNVTTIKMVGIQIPVYQPEVAYFRDVINE